MTEKTGLVWAIDIGNTSLKALRLSNESGSLQVIGFDHIQHGKILSGTGVKNQEKQELIALSLRQFVEQNDISRDEIIVAVPSANSFARFVNLPPVEQKRIPEIVRFEASQQIPFDINEANDDARGSDGGEGGDIRDKKRGGDGRDRALQQGKPAGVIRADSANGVV
jgi:Tfp pilus assembly PilM family ATPase